MLVAGRLAMKLTFCLFTPGRDNPAWITLGISATTVCVMCPLMSLVATLLFKHPGNQIAALWLQTFAVNFPMALCFQLFFAGPSSGCSSGGFLRSSSRQTRTGPDPAAA